jgi:putative transposase
MAMSVRSDMRDQPPDLSRIVIATGNPHKVEELRRLLALPGVEFLGLGDLPDGGPEPEETGDTFEANASIKALAYAARTGLPCLADDSGLEVDALGGAPGVISSHYCTDGRETGMPRDERDRANNQRLLHELEGVPPEARSARFVCVMVLTLPEATGSQPEHPSRGTGFQPVRSIPSDMTRANLTPQGPLRKSRGDLPHWHKDGATYFVTFRVGRGLTLLPAERDIVLSACLHWHSERALVHLCVVMPDHVHLLLSPLPRSDAPGSHDLPELLHSIKSYSANQITRARRIRGTVWQPEYFDRLVRDADEFEELWRYMLDNPVKKGLAPVWHEYRWTRGGEAHRLEAGATHPHRLEAGPTPPSLATSRGTFEGQIGLPGRVPRGKNGFGYDPLFLVSPGLDRTSAELDPGEKARLSHRGHAARAMLERLRALRAL